MSESELSYTMNSRASPGRPTEFGMATALEITAKGMAASAAAASGSSSA